MSLGSLGGLLGFCLASTSFALADETLAVMMLSSWRLLLESGWRGQSLQRACWQFTQTRVGPNAVWQRWQEFLIYVGYTMLAFVVNAFMNSILPIIYRGACT